MSKRQKIKSKKISDVLLSTDSSEAQGFLYVDGDDCAANVYRDEDEEDDVPPARTDSPRAGESRVPKPKI